MFRLIKLSLIPGLTQEPSSQDIGLGLASAPELGKRLVGVRHSQAHNRHCDAVIARHTTDVVVQHRYIALSHAQSCKGLQGERCRCRCLLLLHCSVVFVADRYTPSPPAHVLRKCLPQRCFCVCCSHIQLCQCNALLFTIQLPCNVHEIQSRLCFYTRHAQCPFWSTEYWKNSLLQWPATSNIFELVISGTMGVLQWGKIWELNTHKKRCTVPYRVNRAVNRNYLDIPSWERH